MVTFVDTAAEAVAVIADGAAVMIGGFGAAGQPVELIEALLESGARDLTVVNNNAGNGDRGLAALIRERRVRKIVCSFPRQPDSRHFDAKYRAGEIELELVPRATWPSGSARPAPASAGSSPRPATARCSPRARRPARSTAADYVLESPLHADSRWWARPPTRSATSSTARPRATSGRSWLPPPRRPWYRCARCGALGGLDPETSSPRAVRRPRGGIEHSVVSDGHRRAGAVMPATDRPGPPTGLAALVARDIPAGSVVNLGIGQPTRVATT